MFSTEMRWEGKRIDTFFDHGNFKGRTRSWYKYCLKLARMSLDNLQAVFEEPYPMLRLCFYRDHRLFCIVLVYPDDIVVKRYLDGRFKTIAYNRKENRR